MAITDYKITQGEVDDNKVESAPDVLSDTPTNNKKIFDQLVKVFIAKYNDLIDNINSDFVDSSEFAEGLTVTDKVRWRYALTKGTSIGLNFSGNITQITTGFRTIVGDIDGLTETDFMDCYLSINGTDYECGDSYASGNSILTSAEINGVTVEIIYDTTNGNITLEHATNPLDTLYWNVSIYRSVAEKVPRKALPASVSNDGYTELKNLLAKETERFRFAKSSLNVSGNTVNTVTVTDSTVRDWKKVMVLSAKQNRGTDDENWDFQEIMTTGDAGVVGHKYPHCYTDSEGLKIEVCNNGTTSARIYWCVLYMVVD